MHRPARTLLLSAATLLIAFAGCKKSGQKPVLSTWSISEWDTTFENVFTAASVSRGSDGKFRAVGENPADSIVFSFYRDQLPVTDQKFHPSYEADTTYKVSFEAWMSGRHYYATGPDSMMEIPDSRVTITDGKLQLQMSSGDAAEDGGSHTTRYRISANLQEP